MRKISAIIAALCLSAAFTGCSSVGKDTSTVGTVETTTEVVEEATAEPTEKPTNRVPDIKENDVFEYEILNGEAVIEGYKGSSKAVEIPAEIEGAPVTKIGTYAFEAQYDITSVVLPETITLIAEGAFMDCSSLETINVPEAVAGIDRGAFVACTSLTELTLPEAVAYVREEAFTACEAMTLLTINNPELAYENWGLEELPELKIVAPEGSVAAAWAEQMGKLEG